jgi:peptide/nickel transport system ATP-binding protein
MSVEAAALALRVSNLNFQYKKRLTGEIAGIGAAAGLADISFEISAGETLSIVGKSGSGKSTLVKCIVGLVRPDSGDIFIARMDYLHAAGPARKAIRRKVQAVFQDSASSLSPRMTVEEIISEPLAIHRVGNAQSRRERTRSVVDAVGLPYSFLTRRSAELSGGQRQRVAIARALSVEPELLILDEPLTALDLSIKAQLSNLLAELQEQFGVAYLHISHDLFGVAALSDRVAVMHGGRIVENADRTVLFTNPVHLETRSLLAEML